MRRTFAVSRKGTPNRIVEMDWGLRNVPKERRSRQKELQEIGKIMSKEESNVSRRVYINRPRKHWKTL